MVRASVHIFSWLVLGLWLTGCANALKEVGVGEKDAKDGMHFIVNRDIVNTRAVTTQHNLNGDFHCKKLRTVEEVSQLKQQYPGVEFSRFEDCTPLSQHSERHQYAKGATGPAIEPVVAVGKALLYSGTAAYVGHQIGKGLGNSGTTVNQQGGGAQSEASGGSVNSGNKTTNINPETNINSGNKIIAK